MVPARPQAPLATRHDLKPVDPSAREPRNLVPAWLHSGDMAEFFDAVERAQLTDLLEELGPQDGIGLATGRSIYCG
jgi:hypothetical protein